MYVCIEVALLGSAHGIKRPTGPGGGAHQKWVQCPNPAVPSVQCHARWFVLTGLAFSEPTLLWETKVDLYPHVEGTESYLARL